MDLTDVLTQRANAAAVPQVDGVSKAALSGGVGAGGTAALFASTLRQIQGEDPAALVAMLDLIRDNGDENQARDLAALLNQKDARKAEQPRPKKDRDDDRRDEPVARTAPREEARDEAPQAKVVEKTEAQDAPKAKADEADAGPRRDAKASSDDQHKTGEETAKPKAEAASRENDAPAAPMADDVVAAPVVAAPLQVAPEAVLDQGPAQGPSQQVAAAPVQAAALLTGSQAVDGPQVAAPVVEAAKANTPQVRTATPVDPTQGTTERKAANPLLFAETVRRVTPRPSLTTSQGGQVPAPKPDTAAAQQAQSLSALVGRNDQVRVSVEHGPRVTAQTGQPLNAQNAVAAQTQGESLSGSLSDTWTQGQDDLANRQRAAAARPQSGAEAQRTAQPNTGAQQTAANAADQAFNAVAPTSSQSAPLRFGPSGGPQGGAQVAALAAQNTGAQASAGTQATAQPQPVAGTTQANAPTAGTERASQTQAPMRPSAQRVEIIEQMRLNISRAVQNNQDRVTIQLRPEKLGRVEVKMEMRDGTLRAMITADRAETLDLLQRDARGLERALQDAGVKTDGQSLAFNLRGEQNQQQAGQKAGNHGGPDGQDDTETAANDDTPTDEDGMVNARANTGGVDVKV